jgi:putative proteasome-type protease
VTALDNRPQTIHNPDMTYCLGILTKYGLVMASDSRTNAGNDQVNTTKKMHTFVHPGQRVFVLMASGSLSCTQSIITLLRRDFDKGLGLAKVSTMYDAARVVGDMVRKVDDLDREALERDDYRFNVNLILGGQVQGEPPALYLIYPQGNPLQASDDAPFLQIGEVKYGRPILDRGIQYDKTTLEEAAKYALLSLDSTMKSNVTVGPPIDLMAYSADEFDITRHRRFGIDDPDLTKIRQRWELALRGAVSKLPNFRLAKTTTTGHTSDDSIQMVEGTGDPTETQAQMEQRT